MRKVLLRGIFCLLFAFLYKFCHSQDIGWMSGIWKGNGVFPGSGYSTDFVNTMNINAVVKNRFMGKLSSEVKDGKGTRRDIAFTGVVENGELKFNYGQVLYIQEPPSGAWRWTDCRNCNSTSDLKLTADTIFLTLTNIDCGQYCSGETKYYKLLSEFNDSLQKKIVTMLSGPVNADIGSVKQNNSTATVSNQLGRPSTVIATYKVFSPEIKIMLFDNGEIDDDIVSVYHNSKKIIDKKILGTEPIIYTVTANVNNRVHVFVLVAENLGHIPPNTAFMRIISGEDNYELFAKTNLEENAVIKIEYAGK